jgi:hypothetical protein
MRGIDLHKIERFEDIDPSKVTVYVSQNCIRNAIFLPYSYGLPEVTPDNVKIVIPSIVGLVRGYVVAGKGSSASAKRKSPLFIEDFVVSNNAEINFEQYNKHNSKDSTSIFSRHNIGKVEYESYASINIEDLQFLSLDNCFSRSCLPKIIDAKEGIKIAEDITNFLKTLDFDGGKNPHADFCEEYLRINSLSGVKGEAGILLNNDAVSLVVKEIIELIENLYIQRTAGYLQVKYVEIDYNSGRPMRIKSGSREVNNVEDEYASYYEKNNIKKRV